MEKTANSRNIVLGLIILAAASSRLFPHPDNVAPITAIALFGGTWFANKKMAFAVPFAIMLLSDLILEVLFRAGLQPNEGFHRLMPVVYACFFLTVIIGRYAAGKVSVPRVLFASLLASLLFFVITNFAQWVAYPFYTKDLAGLIECYVAALPFFRNALLGDIFFSTALFGSFYLVCRKFPVLARQ